jgi:hypothetical protein
MPLNYPKRFPKHSIDRTELAYVMAFREYSKDTRRTPFVAAVMRTQLAFVEGLVPYAEELGLDLAAKQREANEFLRYLVILSYYEFGRGTRDGLGSGRSAEADPIDHWGGSIRPWFRESLKALSDWRKYEDFLLGIAPAHVPISEANHKPTPIVESDLETSEGRKRSIDITLERWAQESGHEFSLEEHAVVVGQDRTTISHWQAMRKGKYGEGLTETMLEVLNISGNTAWAKVNGQRIDRNETGAGS